MKKMKCTLAWILALFMTFSGIPAVGNATVYAKKQVKAKTITLNKTSYTLKKGKKLKLKANILPKKSTQKKIAWSSSKKQIATVSKKGEVKAKKNGTTIITAKIKGTKKKATCKITVGTPVTSVKLSLTTKQLKVGESFDLKATVLPVKATTKTVNYTSSDKTIAEVTKSGRVTAKKVGNAIITVSSKDGTNKKAACSVQVVENEQSSQVQRPEQVQKPDQTQTDVKVKKIKLNQKRIYIDLDSNPKQLRASVSPENATNQELIWSSANEEVAKVSSKGLVTPSEMPGRTQITAMATDGSGQKATCEVVVGLGEKNPDEIYGDLKITDIQLNDFVKDAKIDSWYVKLSLASNDIKNNLDKIIPEIKEDNAKYRIEYDDYNDAYRIIISNDKGVEREYEIENSSNDYGNKCIKSFEKNENVTGYDIEENDIYIYMKNTDLSNAEILKTIKPQIEASTVTYEIVYKEEWQEYRIVLKDKDGSSRYYSLYAETDNENNNIINMKSSDPRVKDIKFEHYDIGDSILIYGTAPDLNSIKDTFTYEFGKEVKDCSGIRDDDESDGEIMLTSIYGGKHYYHIFYYYDYGNLNISKIASKDNNIVNDIEIGGSGIYLNAKDIKNDIPYIIENYLTFEYGSDTITGKLVKKDDDYYKYVITDSKTGQERIYNISCWIDYSDDYGVTGIIEKDSNDVVTEYNIYDESISITGTVDTLDEVLSQIKFKYGKDVISGEIKKNEYDEKILVLKCKNDITRTYYLYYYNETEN